jgi:GNAT superfamily N-acetyltransferase
LVSESNTIPGPEHPIPGREHRRIDELRAVLRQSGLRAAAGRVLRSLVARILWLEKDVVVTKSLTGAGLWKGRARLEVRPLQGPNDPAFHALLRHTGQGRLARWCVSYARNGYRGFLAFREGVPIGLMWWVDGRIPARNNHPHLKRFAIQLGAGDAYLFDFFIRPEYRGGGSANEFMTRIEAALGSLGYERLLGCVDVDNKQARWLYSLLGWQDLRTHHCWALFSFMLLTNHALFVRNGPQDSPHGFDYRQVYPRVASH